MTDDTLIRRKSEALYALHRTMWRAADIDAQWVHKRAADVLDNTLAHHGFRLAEDAPDDR